jgi:hypothetical protein
MFAGELASVSGKANAKATSAERPAGLTPDPIVAGIKSAARAHEVLIRSTVFEGYLQRNKLAEKPADNIAGRQQKAGWRELCSYMAAYFAAHQRDRTTETLKISQAKDDILEAAKQGGVSDLPTADTLKEQIAKAKTLLDGGVFKLKT